MAWDKDNLMGKAKAAHARKEKQGILSPPFMRRWVAPSHAMASSLPLPFSLLPPALLAEHGPTWSRIFLPSAEAICHGWVSPELPVHPQSPC